MQDKDLIVIGGGAAGLSVSSGAAQLGLSVTLIESEKNLGGDCLHYGCVPSKAFIHAAKVAHTMRHADHAGLISSEVPVDLAKVNEYVKSVIDKIQKHDDPERFRSYGAEVLFGKAVFSDPYTVTVGDEIRKAKRIVIATGSKPMIPPIPGLNDVDYLSNESIFQLKKLPEHLLVLGGGAIGIELAQAFRRLGSKVTVVEMMDRILPPVDEEAANCLYEQLQKEGLAFYVGTQVTQVTQEKDKIELHCQRGEEPVVISGSHVLVATGRTPNIDLQLDAANVEHSRRGIVVDQRLRTSQKHIYAVGDTIDNPMKFTHLAEHHASVVVSNAVFRLPKKVNHDLVPSVVFTDPECAQVGMTEAQAKASGISYEVARFDFSNVDRALCDNNSIGFCKILIHKNRVKGAVIVGPQAGELIAELGLAIQANVSLRMIAEMIHTYPTLAQINKRVVGSYFSPKLFHPRMQKIIKFIHRWF